MSKSEGLILKYFIVKPKGNNIYAKASREAMLRYAEVINIINPVFANDIIEWVHSEQIAVVGEIYGEGVKSVGFSQYERTNIAEMRPYILGEDLSGISVADADDPKNDMGMIARNSKNHKDQWYVARKYFEDNFEEIKEVD